MRPSSLLHAACFLLVYGPRLGHCAPDPPKTGQIAPGTIFELHVTCTNDYIPRRSKMPHGLGNHLGQTAYMVTEAVAAFANVISVVSSSAADRDRVRGRIGYEQSDLKALKDVFAVINGGIPQAL